MATLDGMQLFDPSGQPTSGGAVPTQRRIEGQSIGQWH